MENLHNEIHEKALSDAKWRQIQQDLNQSVSLTINCLSFNSVGDVLLPFVLLYLFLGIAGYC